MTASFRGRQGWLRKTALGGAVLLAISPAFASETITYGYDSRGRLVKVSHSGTVNNGTTACYAYDKADNRANVTVATSADCANVVTLTVNPTTLPNGTVGSAYSQTITASGGTSPYSYSTTAGTLPAGLSLSGSTGVLSGTPTTAATSSFTITAADSASHTGARAYSITVSSPATLTLSPTTLPNGIVGTAYNQTITTSGGTSPYTYSTTAGSVPAGLTLSSTGVLSGTPTTAATSSFTITATDSASHTGSRAYSITTTTSSNQPPHAVNDSGSQQKCTSKTYNVVANDTDPEGNYPLTVVSVTGNRFYLAPPTSIEFDALNSGGTATYTVQDSLGATSSATLSVSVSGSCTQ